MKKQRLFTQTELDMMCRSPREQMMKALETGNKEIAKEKYAELEDAFLIFHNFYYHWIPYIQEFILGKYGHDALARITPINEIFIQTLKLDMNVDEVLKCNKSAKKEMATLIEAKNTEAAKILYIDMEKGFRNLHDLYNGWTALLMSKIYREYGVEGLEQCHRFVSEKYFVPWMMEDIRRDPKDRIRHWIMLMLGNFAEIRAEEDDEKFTINLIVDGSCGRQVQSGVYEPPMSLAIVKEKHPITFNRGGYTAYQTHLAVMHGIVPIEHIGAPWPVVTCKEKTGAELVLLYKNPYTAAPEYYEMVGKRGPKSTIE